MADLPSYVWLLSLIGVIGTRATVCVNLYQGAIAVGDSRAKARLVAWVAAGALGGWLVIDGLLAWAGAYRQTQWFMAAFVGMFVLTLLAARIPYVARILAEPSMAPRLIEPETFRAVGAVFLVVLALGKLPATFAWLAGFGDVATGIAAPFIATRLRRHPGRRGGLIAYNVFGLLDFVAAFVAANLTGTLLPAVPSSTAAFFVLPLVLIPTAATPLAASLHVISLSKLRLYGRLTLERRPLTKDANPMIERPVGS